MGVVPTLRMSAAPSKVMQLLGVEIDSMAMQMCLSAARLRSMHAAAQQLVAVFASQLLAWATPELYSLLGRLKWAADVVLEGFVAHPWCACVAGHAASHTTG